MNKEIDSYSLNSLMKTKKLNIIDIRDNYKYQQGSIDGSINIPTNYLITNPEDYLNHNEKYYIFCNYGSTSNDLCRYLTSKGYNVVNLIGGYIGYKDSI